MNVTVSEAVSTIWCECAGNISLTSENVLLVESSSSQRYLCSTADCWLLTPALLHWKFISMLWTFLWQDVIKGFYFSIFDQDLYSYFIFLFLSWQTLNLIGHDRLMFFCESSLRWPWWRLLITVAPLKNVSLPLFLEMHLSLFYCRILLLNRYWTSQITCVKRQS